jgi:uncharacterized protein YgiM (DUF1202 family)
MSSKATSAVESVTVRTYKKRTEPRKHYVYEIDVTWADSRQFTIYRGYSEVHSFHSMLLKLFSSKGKGTHSVEEFPALPGRTLFDTAKVAEARLDAINKYCQALIRLPQHISESPHVLSFFTALPGDIKIPQRDWKKQPSLHPLIVPTGNVWENYIVTKNFEGEADSKQLSLKKGDTIQIIRKDDSGWWMGTNGKMAGWVPPSYLRPASTLMESPDEEDSDVIGLNIPGGKVIDTEEYKAIDDFEAEEDSQVSFKEGDIITVVDKEEDGWWFVCVNGREGWAPFSYLEPVNADNGRAGANSEASEASEEEDTLRVTETNITKYGKLPEFVSTAEYTATESDEVSVPLGSAVQVVKKSITGWWTVKYEGKLGLFPAIYLREKNAEVKTTRESFHNQRKLVPRKKTIIKRKTMRTKQKVVRNSSSDSHASKKSLASTPPSSSDEKDSFYKTPTRYARSRSPARPPRPRQTLINRALTPNASPNPSPGPLLSPPRFPSGVNGDDQDVSPVRNAGSESDSLSSTGSNSPSNHRSTSPPAPSKTPSTNGEAALVDALLKVILNAGNTEMKAQLADVMISNPSLAERLKAAKEQ